MTPNDTIIELGHWLRTPPGRYLMAWEQECLDHAVADLFGFHALQVGLPELDGLRANRMPHRWVASEVALVPEPIEMPPPDDQRITTMALPLPVALQCEAEALPFADQSLDLVLLPHTLELSVDPHRALAEVSRVLRPEGRAVIVGLNPASLWSLRQRLGRMRRSLSLGSGPLYLPRDGEFIGHWRLRDWLQLLDFEIESGGFGCYRPPLLSQRWLERFSWMERSGERWWPVLGAIYFVVAVKRVRGVRLIGLAKKDRVKPQAAPAAVANRQSGARQQAAELVD